MGTYIKYIDLYTPENRVYFKDCEESFSNLNDNVTFGSLAEFCDFFQEKLGLDSIVIEEHRPFSAMAFDLIDRAIENGTLSIADLDFIVVAVDFDDQIPNLKEELMERYPDLKAKYIRLNGNYCCNADLAFNVVDDLLNEKSDHQIGLIISGNKLGFSLDSRIVANYAVVSDSATITLVSNTREGAMYEFLNQATVYKDISEERRMKDNSLLHFQCYMHCLANMLDSGIDELGGIILHNANHSLIEEVLRMKNIDINLIDKTNINLYGHLGTSDLVFNLRTYFEANKNKPQDIISMSNGINGVYAVSHFQLLNEDVE